MNKWVDVSKYLLAVVIAPVTIQFVTHALVDDKIIPGWAPLVSGGLYVLLVAAYIEFSKR